MQLSENFYLGEFLRSPEAAKRNIDEQTEPDEEIIVNLEKLAVNVLQPARDHIGIAVHVSSGYRCPRLNKAVGGSSSSDHMYGRAADISVNSQRNRELFFFIKEKCEFKQLIWYYGDSEYPDFIHVSYQEGANRGEVLVCDLVADENGVERRVYREWK